MIHHISIPAQNPLRVANVLAEIWNGQVFPFSPVAGGYMAFTFDEYGTAIEVYPLGTQITPADGHPAMVQKETIPAFTPFHAAISVPTTQEQIERIANREGWRVQLCDRASFKVIEFWVENWLMLELLTPELAAQYLDFVQPEKIKAFFETPVSV